MRALRSSLTLKLVAILVLTWSIMVQAQRRGGGGGGGDDDDFDTGDSGEDDYDREQSDRDNFCSMHARFHSPLWLHRWIGTYYNGTIDVSISPNRSTTSCDEQNDRFERSFDGVLGLLDPRYSGTNDPSLSKPAHYNPFIAVLLGWPESTTQGDLLATRDNGVFIRDNGFPPPVELLFETLHMFFEVGGTRLTWEPITRENRPTCDVHNVTDTDTGYAFDCFYHDQYDFDFDLPYDLPLRLENSQFVMPLSACNDSSLYPLTVGAGYNRTLRGEFDPDEADLRWEGDFTGAFVPGPFDPGSVPSPLSDDPTLLGNFTVRFRGRVDKEHSFEMNVERGSHVTWVEDQDRLDEQTFCPEGSGVSVRGGGMLAMLAVVAMCVIAT